MTDCIVPGPKYQIVEGLKFPPKLPSENIKSALKYTPKENDLFVITYMKTGTTWTQQICTLIFSNGEVTTELKEKGLHHSSPFFEWVGVDAIETVPNPKAIKTHLSFRMMPFSKKAKYIYVARNPKDVLVSWYHHIKLFPDYAFNGTIHDLLSYFVTGDVDYGSYIDHLLSWWEYRNEPNVLFLLYEDMKTDIRGAILKIAAFIGDEYKRRLDSNPEILEKIIKYSDFSFMKETTNKDIEKLWDGLGILYENRDFNFIRKGIIGDWKNELSEEDNKIIEEWFKNSSKGTGIINLWDKYPVFE